MIDEASMLTRRNVIEMAIGFAAGGASLGFAQLTFAQSGTYAPVKVTDGGTIEGMVRFGGNLPEAERIIIGKDNHICGEGHATPDPLILSAERGLKDAVVLIKDIQRGKPWPKRDHFDIVQEKCAFLPYVQVAPKGFELTILNKDPLLHNIHAYELIGRARRTLFNIAQPQANQVDRQRVEVARGNIIEVDCDAHNWMSAWIFTADHPYLAITDSNGRFSIADVPAGSYELTAWHPALGNTSARINVTPRVKASAIFTFGA
jgi:hypothetical protein